MCKTSVEPNLDIDDLKRLLIGQTPLTDGAGNLRVEILQGRGRRNMVVWVSFDEAARLIALYGSQAALMTLDAPAGGAGPCEGLT